MSGEVFQKGFVTIERLQGVNQTWTGSGYPVEV